MNKVYPLLIPIFILFSACKNNQETELKLSDGINVLDRESPIESLAELREQLKGKPAYIDRWATWCEPCLKEFQYNEELHAFLDSAGIQIVYLNSDRSITDEKYFDFIETYRLKGQHLRLNNDLQKDMEEEEVFFPMIPQYMIMDKNGNILENQALRPSHKERLYNQLTDLLQE